MKKTIIIIVLVGMLSYALFDLFLSDDESVNQSNTEKEDYTIQSDSEDSEVEADVGLDIGSEAPDFEVETLKGETVKLSDYRGEKIMLNFWGTWCPPCRAEMPDMQKFYEEHDVTILAMNLFDTESSMQDVEDFVEDFGLTFPVLIDEGEVATDYQVIPVPTSYMIDSNGIIQYKRLGVMNYDMMVQELEKMN
ncbi:alkyl hydroperoxide reductase [Halalkalibacillus sediminis]|uniref:Alkyl hydroperoxide reductase n=1 Tax=Halalkalibacillus sediminis TaxID=2018042 RepID=A0A2I0QWI7_9BACI|nr:redoxin domain-containing protein [Halalkalibacillus sediminis]PKR78716.1 alkyl hydroperoxide reductase [Halalkalibacillus sediminis]